MAVKDRMKPVSLEDFGAHVSRMHSDRDKWFEMEYTVSIFFFKLFQLCEYAYQIKLRIRINPV